LLRLPQLGISPSESIYLERKNKIEDDAQEAVKSDVTQFE
jgi:hypothetical protein